MRVYLLVSILMLGACGGGSPEEASVKSSAKSPPRRGKKPLTSEMSMQLMGRAGEVDARIYASCNCAKKPRLNVTTTGTLITIQGILPDGPLARCFEPCSLSTRITGLTPGDYRVLYVPDGGAEAQFSGDVRVR